MMKKLFYILIIVVVLFTVYAFMTIHSYKSQQTLSNDVGLASTYYISQNKAYPDFWSEYLFNDYEYPSLLNLQRESPKPYEFVIDNLYLTESADMEEVLKIDRIEKLEESLICTGLSEERVALYKQKFFKNGKMPTYIENKYITFDYDTLNGICKKSSN